MKFLMIFLTLAVLSPVLQAGSPCLIKKNPSVNLWSIHQNGSMLTTSYTSLTAVVDQLTSLRASGVCSAPVAGSGSCSIKKGTNQIWYVMLGGEQVSGAFTSLDSAIAQMQSLTAAQVCAAAVTSPCQITKMDGNNLWQIFQAGGLLTSTYSNFEAAKSQLQSLKERAVCRSIPDARCTLKKRENQNLWFVEQDGKALTSLSTSINEAVATFKGILSSNVCLLSLTASCELKKRENAQLWYVQIGGAPISTNFTQMTSAIGELKALKSEGVCHDYVRQRCKVVKNPNSNLWSVHVGGTSISGTSYTNISSATSAYKTLVESKLCEDVRFQSPCLVTKHSNSNLWSVDQDGQHLGPTFTNMNSAKALLTELSDANVCNKNLQPGCQLVKRSGANLWYLTQEGEPLSSLYTNINAATQELAVLYRDGVCKRGECEIRQDRFGGVSIIREGYRLGNAENLDGAISGLSDLLNRNSCDLPQNSKVCSIRHSHGRFYLLDNQRPLGASDNYNELVGLRTRLQQLGYCTSFNPNEIIGDGYSHGPGEYNGPRTNTILEFIDDSIVAPLPPTISH
ncbi:MAG: hypothetical protein A2X86_14645 [Bdellovibrionales bacterium GWA2_49_15]|nr:MAG: hypothetical protein A2X86_14645 [Bdellovibrionales bacterium GWA2_49_15]HAZ13421.1 hypothetical protein [Bdellovibrionales bacterium]